MSENKFNFYCTKSVFVKVINMNNFVSALKRTANIGRIVDSPGPVRTTREPGTPGSHSNRHSGHSVSNLPFAPASFCSPTESSPWLSARAGGSNLPEQRGFREYFHTTAPELVPVDAAR